MADSNLDVVRKAYAALGAGDFGTEIWIYPGDVYARDEFWS
jgi:hypothetical protein